jgi:hypothetical protein
MANLPDRLVLENVPRVQFYQGGPACPEDIPFPSVMRALLEYFNETDFGCHTCRTLKPGCKINCSYSFFVGVTGVASFLNWKPGWEGDNVEIMYMSDDPAAPFERAFRAAGYAVEYIDQKKGADEALFRQRIMESIQRGRPVLAFGPIGPPESAIICGYDAGGEVLIGWNFFQDFPPFNTGVEYEPSGMFRKRDWFNCQPDFSVMLIGEKQPNSPLSETYRQALEWMLKVARTPVTFGGRCNGLAAYSAWKEQLLHDEVFPDDEAALRERHDAHNGVVGMLAEARWYGALFLIQAGNGEFLHYRCISDLLHAAACYAEIHNLMWKIWNLAGGNGNPEAYRYFADPNVRRKMVPIIEEAHRQDEEATRYIEQALAKLNAK